MKAPKLRPDGSCPECKGGWQCSYHQAEGLAADRRRFEAVRLAVIGLRESELGRTCARLELESDENGTARAKACRLLGY